MLTSCWEVEMRWRSKRKRWSVETDEEETDEEELEEQEEVPNPTKDTPLYSVGSYVVATYDDEWYVALVEGEEPEDESPGFTMLKYMERKARNQFVWGTAKDTLKTNNRDIVMQVEPPIPVSSRFWGLPKEVVKDIENRMRVKWSIIDLFFPFIFLSVTIFPSLLSFSFFSFTGSVIAVLFSFLSHLFCPFLSVLVNNRPLYPPLVITHERYLST